MVGGDDMSKHLFDVQKLFDLISEWKNQKYGAIRECEKIENCVDSEIRRNVREAWERVSINSEIHNHKCETFCIVCDIQNNMNAELKRLEER